MYFVYILRTSINTLYTGITTNVERRVSEHINKGKKGAKYTRSFEPVEVVYQESFGTRSEALKREYEIKQMSRSKKWQLISQNQLVKNRE